MFQKNIKPSNNHTFKKQLKNKLNKHSKKHGKEYHLRTPAKQVSTKPINKCMFQKHKIKSNKSKNINV